MVLKNFRKDLAVLLNVLLELDVCVSENDVVVWVENDVVRFSLKASVAPAIMGRVPADLKAACDLIKASKLRNRTVQQAVTELLGLYENETKPGYEQ